VVAAFVATGIAWILFADLVLYAATRNPALVARFETAKAWLLVGLAALLLYAVTWRIATRLALARATISAVVESIADGVLLLGPDHKIVYANPAATQLLGVPSAGDLVGMGAPEFSRRFRLSYPNGCLVPPDQYASQRVFTEGGPLNYKAVLHPPGGGEVVFLSTAAAVRDEVGAHPRLVVSVMHDITQTDHLDRIRDQFFAAAAHALKTPVAVIKGRAHVLSSTAGPRFGPSIASIERQCGRMDRLLQNLLALARIRSETFRLFPAEVEVAPLVEAAAREMALASLDHDVRTHVEAHPRVHGDPERLAMAVRNLIEDAFRLSLPGTPVTVLLEERGRDVEIGLRYHPLPAADGEEAAELRREYDDLGVRHHVTESIVAGHGGVLREEADGPETTVWMCLPAVEPAIEASHGPS
jgi:signal transduction histidine kinase